MAKRGKRGHEFDPDDLNIKVINPRELIHKNELKK